MKEKIPIKRSIKSYVRRQGRMSERQQNALTQHWVRYGLSLDQGVMDFQSCFGRVAPVVLEIGFGMGDSLFKMAQSHPEIDFVGIEVHRPGVGALLANLYDVGITNIRIFQEDAKQVLEQAIPNHSLNKIQIFFPDPWPKRSHHKRRLIQEDFVGLLHKKLINSGIVHLATDWEDYAKHMMRVMTQASGFTNQAGAGQYVTAGVLRPKTKFETRGEKLGHITRDLVFVKDLE